MNQEDAEHLRLLSIFYYVVAGLAALFSCIPILHLVFGVLMLTGVLPIREPGAEQMTTVMGIFFVTFSILAIAVGLAFAVLLLFTGNYLKKRVHYTFCLVMACVACVFMPFGTVLGVFTILVLVKPSVKAAFAIATPLTNEPPN